MFDQVIAGTSPTTKGVVSLKHSVHSSDVRYDQGRMDTRQNAERSGSAAGRIRTVTVCGSIGPICGSVITVALWLGLGLVLWLV